MAVGAWPSVTPSTSSRLEAGSVLTISTRLPASASARPVAQDRSLADAALAGEEQVRVSVWGAP
jgi:hypothetical protein